MELVITLLNTIKALANDWLIKDLVNRVLDVLGEYKKEAEKRLEELDRCYDNALINEFNLGNKVHELTEKNEKLTEQLKQRGKEEVFTSQIRFGGGEVKKIALIKALRRQCVGLGLKQAKELVEMMMNDRYEWYTLLNKELTINQIYNLVEDVRSEEAAPNFEAKIVKYF